MFSFQSIAAVAAVLLATARLSNAQSNANCLSAGFDLGNGGVYYFNLASLAPFSFKSNFQQCFGTTTPILQFPDGTQYTCSPTDLNLGVAETTCPIQHAQLLAGGIYSIFFPEIGFVRAFSVVNTQVIIIATSTITATGTVTPTITIENIVTVTIPDTITLPTSTVTLPAATKGTLTLSPMTTTTTTRSTLRTSHTATIITVTSTITKAPTPSCTTAVGISFSADHPATATPPSRIARRLLNRKGINHDAHALAKRDGPDGNPTTTVTTLVATATFITLPATSTVTTASTVDVTSTATITPSPFTTFSGTVEKTITLPVKTVTTTVRTVSTTTVTQTKTRKAKATFTAEPTTC